MAEHPFAVRAIVEQLHHPYWYADHGRADLSNQFWDQDAWEKALRSDVKSGYNAIVYFCEPWLEHQWQTFLIPHEEFPEARELELEQCDQVIKQARWIFRTAKELGLMNFMMNHCVITTQAFARAHGMEEPTPVARARGLKGHWCVRNELTRAFTEAAIAELFRTYEDLDGLYGAMAEQLPGRRSTWYSEAIVPGLRRSGRRPVSIVFNWMMPLDDFLEDIARPDVYDNTWLAVETNGETITDARPWPTYYSWIDQAERLGIPTVLWVVPHNLEDDGFPANSPRLAFDILREFRRFDGCVGYCLQVIGRSASNGLFRTAFGYYGQHSEPYSDEPWIAVLEERFGDRESARHVLNAYNVSARITPEVGAIAWCPHDSNCHYRLTLRYWHWMDDNVRYHDRVSPGRSGSLLPLREYAHVVAKYGPGYRDNNGSDHQRNPLNPGWQELIWGDTDYPTTPESHMRKIRAMGAECLREAEAAKQTVGCHHDEAARVVEYMRAYKLLTDYYERKVLAAISALIYRYGGEAAEKSRAERLADEAVDLYQVAIEHIWCHIDEKKGSIRSKWANEGVTLPELIDVEKTERQQLGALFGWAER
jgi:hypothetical protein